MKKIKNIITVAVFSILILSLSAMCFFAPEKVYSKSERRLLAERPLLTEETIKNGTFMTDFEKYSTDHFPYRDRFRTLKAVFSKSVLNRKEINGLFSVDGHVSALDKELNIKMLDYSAKLFRKIYDKNIKGTNSKVYFSIVHGKNEDIGKGYPVMNYTELDKYMEANTSDFMTFIPISHLLSADDYYRTDSHWKQEKITDVAEYLAEEMGADVKTDYKVNVLDNPFYGVYAGQSALVLKPDTIKYLTNDTLNNCTVTYYDTGKPEIRDMYNMEKAFGKDPYEMFLSGVAPLIVIDNPSANTDKELVMFRDSFGSSLAPLMVEGYKKVTVVDVRYIQSAFIGNFVTFNNSDVLFLYSAELLNNSLAMK